MAARTGARQLRKSRQSNVLLFPAGTRPRAGEVTLERVQEAAERIRPYIRRTPIMQAWIPSPFEDKLIPVWLKLENLQVGGEVDARGVLNFVLSLPPEEREKGVVTASWGGVGSALAYAGHRLGFPAKVFLSGPAATREKLAVLERWGAEVVVRGSTWSTTHGIARHAARAADMAYLHPFAEPALIAGHGTVALEILEDVPDLSMLLVQGDGGGVTVSGAAVAAKELSPDVRVIGVEVDRVARLHHCITNGRLADFPTSRGYLGPPRVARINYDLVRRYVDEVVVVTDEERQDTLRVLWSEMEVSAGPFGATAITAALWGRVSTPPRGNLCAVVGAAGEDGLF